MELRNVDPRTLAFNPDNPRRIKAGDVDDRELAASIGLIGLVNLPLVRETNGILTVIDGERRVRAFIALERSEIAVNVLTDDDRPDFDHARSVSANVVRTDMNEVDVWRSISSLLESGWTEGSVCSLFNIGARQLGRLRLLASILPAMLDWIAKGRGPEPRERAVIANATLEEQAAVWKKHKPKRGAEQVYWHQIASALRKERIAYEVAAFDAATAERFGIQWISDLFAPADSDGRFTEQVEAFTMAQAEWMETHLPPNGEVISLDQWGSAQLPKKAERVWGKPQKSDRIGVYLDRNSLQIKQIAFRMPKAPAKGAARNTDAEDGTEGIELPKKTRAEISSKGVDMIGQYRTDALRETIVEQAAIADPWHLVGGLVLALAGRNVRVEGESAWKSPRNPIAAGIIADGLLTGDVSALRHAAGSMLAHVLSAETGVRNSGPAALVIGHSFGSDAKLPNMAHEDFLKTLSKDAITKVVRDENIAPRNTGKEMRAALIAQVGEGVWLHPTARFEPGEADLATIASWIVSPEDGTDEGDAPAEATDPGEAEADSAYDVEEAA